MKFPILTLLGVSVIAVSPLMAANYPDTIGDSTTSDFLDITSVDLNNDANTLSFKVNVAGDPTSVTWNKYLIGLDTAPGGNTTGPDGWGKPISMSVGAWTISSVPGPIRARARNFACGTAAPGRLFRRPTIRTPHNVGIVLDSSSVTKFFDALALALGDSFNFDIYTTSDGNSALDAAGSATALTWNNDAYDSGNDTLNYTIVPEPAVGSLLGLGALLPLLRRR